MYQKVIQPLAPSMRAASISELGTVCSPVRSSSAMNGVVFQTSAMMMVVIAVSGEPYQLMFWSISPACSRM